MTGFKRGLLAPLVVFLGLMGCAHNPIQDDRRVQNSFADLQPFADEIAATHERTGRPPKDGDDLFLNRKWPGYSVKKGEAYYQPNYGRDPRTGEPVTAGRPLKPGSYYIIRPVDDPDVKLIVSYQRLDGPHYKRAASSLRPRYGRAGSDMPVKQGDYRQDDYGVDAYLEVYNYMSRASALHKGADAPAFTSSGGCRWNFWPDLFESRQENKPGEWVCLGYRHRL